ncbi:hypothetical protein F4821DRAFT_200971 [Hypoxylon rubiginosum]|uniref:Uncharacterized protein n=1 Tax=Hypoxylon rubiginosum TaxID=110542 RepID=A0ACC0DGB9_9PEZI|nr:hypothetical protein F4821DRAFT_200971 [Hypoxylon rubiginosum]
MSSRSAWSESEKMSFLHQVIVQLSNNGAHIDYGALDMPGRTPKALKHQLDKVRAAGAAHQKESGQAPAEVSRSRARGPANKAAGTPTKAAAKGKRAKPHDEEEDDSDPDDSDHKDDDLEVPTTRRIKRQRRAPRSVVKKEAVESDADTIIAGKSSDGDAAGSISEFEPAVADVKRDSDDSGLDLDDEA